MKNYNLLIILFVICGCFLICTDDSTLKPEIRNTRSWERKATPPRGWNSYTGYGWIISDSIARENLEVFSKKYAPYGYEYFVLDDGWQGHFYILPDKSGQFVSMFEVRIDEFGRCLPDSVKFPEGLQPLIDEVHSRGLLFGVWIMCGAPIKAARNNLLIKGTSLTFRQELDTNSVIDIIHGNYHFRRGSPAMQAYYNSVFELLAQWKVDFVKYDWITDSPEDIDAVVGALNRCGRSMVLSLSAGGDIGLIENYRQADMVRISSDVWDDRNSLQKVFDAWHSWSYYAEKGFWIDLDMIPFGSFPGFNRCDTMSVAGKKTFMTQRALAASPLIMGGALPLLDSISYSLTVDPDMLACNSNGICAKLIRTFDTIEIWKTVLSSSPDTGWIGIFNRSLESRTVNLTTEDLGLDSKFTYTLFDIWEKVFLPGPGVSSRIEADGVLFINYRKKN